MPGSIARVPTGQRLLSAQLCSPVRWRQSVLRLGGIAEMEAADPDADGDELERVFVEVGPGAMLAPMISHTLPGASVLTLAEPSHIDGLVDALSGESPLHSYALDHQGEQLYVSERLVISPTAGVFEPVEDQLMPGSEVKVGTLLGTVSGVEVRSPFDGTLKGSLPIPGNGCRRASRSRGCGRHDRPGHHRLGDGPAGPGGHQRGPRDPVRHHRRVDRGAQRHPHPPCRHRTLRRSPSRLLSPRGRARAPPAPGRRGRARGPRRAGITGADIGLLILCTTTPGPADPGHLGTRGGRPGHPGGAMDINAACAGFTYGLVTASGLVGAGATGVLLIGAETLTRATNWQDRTNAFLFGDGAGAVVIEAVPGEGSLLGWDLGVDGTLVPLLLAHHGSGMVMRGKEVFRRAVLATVESARASLEKAKLTIDDIALFVPHQANLRIMEAVRVQARSRPLPDRIGDRPHRQHQLGVHPTGAGRRDRRGPALRRGPHPSGRLRCRDDLGVGGLEVGTDRTGTRAVRGPPGGTPAAVPAQPESRHGDRCS